MNPSGHTVLITGGATGIGFAIAKKFHAEGNRVIVVGRREQKLAAAAAALPGISTCAATKTDENGTGLKISLHNADAPPP